VTDARARWAGVSPAVWGGVVAAVVAAVTVASRPAADRVLTGLLLVVGLAVGVALGMLAARRPAAGRRSTMARLNDGAFAVVLLAVWGLSLAVLGPWAGLLAGLGAGALVAVLARRG
jgi:hypothetical protein